MELIEKQSMMLFPTPIFTGKISDITLCDRIENKLREMHKSGHGVPHKFGKSNFLSSDDIHLLPEMKELVDLVMTESGYILDIYKMKRDSHYITNMWANITSPRGSPGNVNEPARLACPISMPTSRLEDVIAPVPPGTSRSPGRRGQPGGRHVLLTVRPLLGGHRGRVPLRVPVRRLGLPRGS